MAELFDFADASLDRKLARLRAMSKMPDIDVTKYFTWPEFSRLMLDAVSWRELHGVSGGDDAA